MSVESHGLVSALAGFPARLAALVRGRDDRTLRARPAPEAWSALEVLAHLRSSDAILAPRLYQMLVRESPPLPGFDERRWAEVAGYADLPVSLLLESYAARRAELVAMLRRLSAADWQRTGRHEERGEITMVDVARWIADHEAEHLAQLEALLG